MWVVVMRPRAEVFSLPIEDKKTARGGLAAMVAFLMAAMRAVLSGKPASGVRLGGIMAKIPSTPVKAATSSRQRVRPLYLSTLVLWLRLGRCRGPAHHAQ